MFKGLKKTLREFHEAMSQPVSGYITYMWVMSVPLGILIGKLIKRVL